MPKPKATLAATSLWQFDHAGDSASAAGNAEVVAYDPGRNTLFVLGGGGVDLLNATTGALGGTLSGADLVALPGDALDPGELGGGNSVALHGNHVAVAYNGAVAGANGWIGLYGLDEAGNVVEARAIESGAVPDMVVFTPDGSTLLVAVEGEPTADYASDPLGGIQVIDVATGASRFLDFSGFDTDALRAEGVRISGPGATAATDIEPEYIAISADGRTAYVTLQENNAIAVVDLDAEGGPVITDVFALGAKDLSHPGAGIDASDRDGALGNIQQWPIQSLYMPDAIATFDKNGKTYLVTANEGDAREWGSYTDVARISTLQLDPTAFPDAATLQANPNLGRLDVLTTEGDFDGDGDYDALYTLGGRSFSIWEVQKDGLKLTYDSGDLIERTLAEAAPGLLDDTRSDNKGPEPEHVTLSTIDGEVYAFVGLERSDAIMVFHITGPQKASYAGLIETDDAPETFWVVDGAAEDGSARLFVASEGDGTSHAYDLQFDVTGMLAGPPIQVAGHDII